MGNHGSKKEEPPTLELANGEPLGAHWIYQNRDMKEWYIKGPNNDDQILHKFVKRVLGK